MASWTQLYWLESLLLLVVNVLSDRSQKDCQNNEVYIYCGSCEATCRTPAVINCKKECRPARCECRSRSGFVRAHDGTCIHVSECGSYRNTYPGSNSAFFNKSPSPPPLRNTNLPAVASSGFGFPSPNTGQILGNGLGDSTAFQHHIRGAPPAASPLLPPALSGRGQQQQTFFADVPQEPQPQQDWQQQQQVMPPSQRPLEVPPASESSNLNNWPSLQTTVQTASEISSSNSWDFMQDSSSSIAPSQLPPGTSLPNRNTWGVSDPTSSSFFTPQPAEDNLSNAGWGGNAPTGQQDQSAYKTPSYQSYPPSPPKAPKSYGASSRQMLPFAQAQSQPQLESHQPVALSATDSLSVSCVEINCAGFAAPKPVMHQQDQPSVTLNSPPKSYQPYLFAYISHPPGYGPAEMMQAKTEKMGKFSQASATQAEIDARKYGSENANTPAEDITILPPNFRIYRNV